MTSINCVQIGKIVEFDHENQTASVQVDMKYLVKTNPDLTKVYEEYPLILRCPVVVLFGGVDFLSMPITAGDSCLLLFNDRSIENWMRTGENVPPTIPHYHNLNDAIALVGIRPLTNSIATYLANGIRLSHGNGSSQIDLTDALISTIAATFLHTGNMQVTGRLDGGTVHAGNGATGTFGVVNVVDGIVISGSEELT